jgi:hypothetical protein
VTIRICGGCIQLPMPKLLWVIVLGVGCAQAQSATPATSNSTTTQPSVVTDDLPAHKAEGKVSLARGVLKQLDPIHDELIIEPFGGGHVRIRFDTATKLLPENTALGLTKLPIGSVVSVDTAIQDGKLYAVSVRTGNYGVAELNGQIERYDPTRSELTLNDRLSPESVLLRVSPTTTVIKDGKPASLQALASGMLVRVSFSAQHTAREIEILAERGSSFTFRGRIIAVDLRSKTVSLSNDTDQSLRELVFRSLDSNSLNLLREGSRVTVEAEFDGDRYNIRSVAQAPAQNP